MSAARSLCSPARFPGNFNRIAGPMAVTTLPVPTTAPPHNPRKHHGRRLHVTIEVVVLCLVGFSPWAFASVHPLFEFVLLAGVGLLLLLWGADMLLQRRL